MALSPGPALESPVEVLGMSKPVPIPDSNVTDLGQGLGISIFKVPHIIQGPEIEGA